ncbi:MAG TPA: SH3 domain-containing protein [Propionibacteriaceae bacterium]|nr:SH3 domain-containing protein [Propionibacteriaceae bacterium]
MPSVMVGVLGIGVAAATWPGNEPQTAYPAPAVNTPLAVVDSPSTTREPNLRRTASPTPTAKPSATRKASAKPKVTVKAKPVAKPTPKPAPTPALKVVGSRYATASLNVRTAPNFESDVVDVVSAGDKVSVTSVIYNGFRFISYNDRGRWISNKYPSDKKPVVQSSGGGTSTSSSSGISSASCSKSSSIESGLVPNAIKVYRAICARYPQVSSFGGRRSSGGFHGTGQAVDVMISNSSVGWDIANWTRANASELGVSEVIYYQKIWTVQRSSDGWRPMADRGSASANHYDHVHVSVY